MVDLQLLTDLRVQLVEQSDQFAGGDPPGKRSRVSGSSKCYLCVFASR